MNEIRGSHGGNVRNQKCRHERRALRVQRAVERMALSDSQSPEERLAVLDARLGKGVGAMKERARLAALIAKAAEAKPAKK